MNVSEITQQIAALPIAQRIELAKSLWESIDENEIESPAWHSEVLAEREAEIQSGKAKFLSLDELKTTFSSTPL